MIKAPPKTAKTYQEWLAAGYQVQKGEHCIGRRLKDNAPLFAKYQVAPISIGNYEYDIDDEEDAFDPYDIFIGDKD